MGALRKHLASLVIVVFLAATPGAGARAQSRTLDLQGEVKDQQGAVIVGAKVNLMRDGDSMREAISDEQGRFRFRDLPGGAYTLKVIGGGGFAAHEQTLTLHQGVMPARVVVTLYPTISETVTVDNATAGAALDTGFAAGTQVLTKRDIEGLPDDPTQLNEQLQQLATSSGSVPGQAEVTVDGFLTGGRLPPKSSIREVRINPDRFSAEYDTPPWRSGRIEILTKPGADSYHGAFFLNFNHSALNAREAFALTRAPSHTRRYGLNLGGPIVRKKAGFFIDFEKRDIDEAAIVNAIILNDAFQPVSFKENVPTPKRLLIGSARADWQITPMSTLVVRYDYNSNRLNNEGVGGFNLPDRAFNDDFSEHSLRLTGTSVLNRSMVNEARLGLTWYRQTQTASSNASVITVPGAFTSGGALPQSLARNERRIEAVDNISVSAGNHTLRLGVQVFNRQIADTRSDNPHGTFLFGGGLAPELDATGMPMSGAPLVYISGLEQYRRTLLALAGGVPTRFAVTRGTPAVSVNQWRAAGFMQDSWRVRSNLSLSFGFRFESQTEPSDKASLAPRIGVAYSPDKEQNWVLRARAGIFYDRISEALTLDALRLDGQRLQQFIIDAPSFPDPFRDGTPSDSILTVRRLDRALRPPSSLQMQIEVERQLPRGWKIQLSQTWTRGWAELRSRNINAPVVAEGVDPRDAPRPFGVAQNIYQFEASGRTSGRVLFVGVNQSVNKFFSLFAGYLNFDFHTDADTPYSLPQSSYDLSGEWARPFWQSRHRLFAVGNLNLPWRVRASLSLNATSGTPFNITTGRDNNGDGNFNDRPDVADASDPQAIVTGFGAFDPTAINGTLGRNTGTNPSRVTLDLNLSRGFTFCKQGTAGDRCNLTFNVRASNLLNHTNPLGLNGVVTSPFFGRANAALAPRRIELGIRFSF